MAFGTSQTLSGWWSSANQRLLYPLFMLNVLIRKEEIYGRNERTVRS